MDRKISRSVRIFAATALLFATAAEASYRARGSSGGFDDESAAYDGFAAWYAGGIYSDAGGAMDPNG